MSVICVASSVHVLFVGDYLHLQPCYWLNLGSGAAAASLLSGCLINMTYFHLKKSKQNVGNTGKVILAQR